MRKKPKPLHHTLLFTGYTDASAGGPESFWTMEFTVFRSRNGFQRRAEWVGIFEKPSKDGTRLDRKVFRKALAFPEGLESLEDLTSKSWRCDTIHFSPQRYSGRISSSEGELTWDFSIESGYRLDFSPLHPWLHFRTLSTQIPLRGSWALLKKNGESSSFSWNSSESPARAILQRRDESKRVWPTLWFHSQSLRESHAPQVNHCAEGLHASPGLTSLANLTSVSAFDTLKTLPRATLWKALRSKLQKQRQGWSFRSDQGGQELRGKIEVDPKHWVTLRYEDVDGKAFYRSSARRARLEIQVLQRGKPQGLYRTGEDMWLEWTTRRPPVEAPELR
ncbi:MAG: hypothetical protein RJB38_1585 [Pseudomonadota bacterium]|jgi:hypothetical protein